MSHSNWTQHNKKNICRIFLLLCLFTPDALKHLAQVLKHLEYIWNNSPENTKYICIWVACIYVLLCLEHYVYRILIISIAINNWKVKFHELFTLKTTHDYNSRNTTEPSGLRKAVMQWRMFFHKVDGIFTDGILLNSGRNFCHRTRALMKFPTKVRWNFKDGILLNPVLEIWNVYTNDKELWRQLW